MKNGMDKNLLRISNFSFIIIRNFCHSNVYFFLSFFDDSKFKKYIDRKDRPNVYKKHFFYPFYLHNTRGFLKPMHKGNHMKMYMRHVG